MNVSPYSVRRLLMGAILVAGLFSVFTQVGNVSAGSSVCRADPIAYLSNGLMVTMVTDLTVDVGQINRINYTVHLPPNVTVTRIAYDVGGIGVKETVIIMNDQSAGNYAVDQFAMTQVPAFVTATNTIRTTVRTSTGVNQQTLSTSFTNP